MPTILISSFNVQFFFGGTSLLIVVGVGLDTAAQIEAHLISRSYEGFMKGKFQGPAWVVRSGNSEGDLLASWSGKGTQAKMVAEKSVTRKSPPVTCCVPPFVKDAHGRQGCHDTPVSWSLTKWWSGLFRNGCSRMTVAPVYSRRFPFRNVPQADALQECLQGLGKELDAR
ncbi:MAG: hypothetical protein R2864_09800 [Syntrophotaleaceae bacterium]